MLSYLTLLKISTTTFPLTSSDLHLFPYVQDLRNHLNDAIKKFFLLMCHLKIAPTLLHEKDNTLDNSRMAIFLL